jgi:ribosomal protein L11 methyltransferase
MRTFAENTSKNREQKKAVFYLIKNVMDYYQFNIVAPAETAELLPALLADTAFDTFEETPEGVAAYMPADVEHAKTAEALLTELQDRFPLTWEKQFIPGQNWNEIWETNFQPVIVNDFCAVRADFHAPIQGVRHELIINPKMAFGTGHHETTWQCIDAMQYLPMQQASVLDYGCGTGILGILAARLGAKQVEAIDIEAESWRNTLENARINNTPQVMAACGILADVTGRNFNGILANINRNVILDSMPHLADFLVSGGWLLVSGILEQDTEVVNKAAADAGLRRERATQRGNWMCVVYRKK